MEDLRGVFMVMDGCHAIYDLRFCNDYLIVGSFADSSSVSLMICDSICYDQKSMLGRYYTKYMVESQGESVLELRSPLHAYGDRLRIQNIELRRIKKQGK